MKQMKHKKFKYQERYQIIDALRYNIKMEYEKITNLLHAISNSVIRFNIKKWIEVHDPSRNANDKYKPSKQIRFKASMLQSNFCHYSDVYIVVKETITVTEPNNNAYDKKLVFQINAPSISCITKIIKLIDNSENVDIVMHMYNLIEYIKNYSKKSHSLWN